MKASKVSTNDEGERDQADQRRVHWDDGATMADEQLYTAVAGSRLSLFGS